MTPFRSLLHPAKGTGSVAEWYFRGGGLRQRLRVLARVAEVLVRAAWTRAGLHRSFRRTNVFVSESSDVGEVRLNRHRQRASGDYREGSRSIRRDTAPPRSSAGPGCRARWGTLWTFAVIAFEALSLVLLWLGDQVQYGEPEMEERALEGRLPWIDAEDDDRNRSSHGIPRDRAVAEAPGGLRPGLRAGAARSRGAARAGPLGCAAPRGRGPNGDLPRMLGSYF